MRIVWCTRKYLDVSLDSATWTRMVHELVHAGHDVTLMTGFRRTKPDFGLNGRIAYVRTIKVPVINAFTFLVSASRMIRRETLRREVDAVILDHLTMWAALPTILVMRRAADRPRYVLDVRTLPVETGRRMRDGVERWVFEGSLRFAARWCDGFTAITRPLAEIIAHTAGVPLDSVGIWTSGVDADAFNPAACGDTEREDTRYTVMYHGALLESRGVFEAADAMGVVRDRGMSQIRLRLIGSGLDASRLASHVEEAGLADVVYVEPPVSLDAVPGVLCGADIGLLPFPDLECWRVSSPLKLLEYLSMSRPVIVTPLRCNSDVLGASGYAVWSEGPEPESLANAIIQAFQDRARLEESAVVGARSVVLERYTWKRQAEQLVEYLRGLRG